jgi:hypothetical protein
MTRSSQDILPILLLGVCATAAAPEFDLSAGAIVSVLAAAVGDQCTLRVGGQIDVVVIVQ